jgi:hypothetical protein
MFDGEDRRIVRRVSSPGLKGDGTSSIGRVVGEWRPYFELGVCAEAGIEYATSCAGGEKR